MNRIKVIQKRWNIVTSPDRQQPGIADNKQREPVKLKKTPTSLVVWTTIAELLDHETLRNALDILGESNAFTLHVEQRDAGDVHIDVWC